MYGALALEEVARFFLAFGSSLDEVYRAALALDEVARVAFPARRKRNHLLGAMTHTCRFTHQNLYKY